MANRINGAGEKFLETMDFSSAIAACDAVIKQFEDRAKSEDKAKTVKKVKPDNKVKSEEEAKSEKKDKANADHYLCRGYAWCFVEEKDKANLDKAIADCSMAISMDNASPKSNPCLTAHRVRALAHYLKGDKARALTDCNVVLYLAHQTSSTSAVDIEDTIFVLSMCTKMLCDAGRYEKAFELCQRYFNFYPQNVIITATPNPNIFPSIEFVDEYLLACKRLQG